VKQLDTKWTKYINLMLTNFSHTCIQRTLVSDLGTGPGCPGLNYATYASLLSVLIPLIVCILEMLGSVLCLDASPDRFFFILYLISSPIPQGTSVFM